MLDDPIRIIHRSLIFDTQLKVMLTPERPHGSLMAEWPAWTTGPHIESERNQTDLVSAGRGLMDARECQACSSDDLKSETGMESERFRHMACRRCSSWCAWAA